jgi:protocatechuate 3,4-dioxygenase beta subunit
VKRGGKELLVTQCYIKGDPTNEKDGVWRGIKDVKQREAVSVEFAPMKSSRAGELAAKFDIVLGLTPAA